jgi:hypothetical protein
MFSKPIGYTKLHSKQKENTDSVTYCKIKNQKNEKDFRFIYYSYFPVCM